MKIFLNLVLSMVFFASCVSFAANTQSGIKLNKYYAASCSNYTGTWKGFFTDPTDLFGNGGPWPVSVSLYNKGNKVIGRVSSRKAPKYVSGNMKGKLWADCENGKLSNIFLGKKGSCGAFAQKGLLISKNVIVLAVNYQSAMSGTTFLLFLKRVNNQYAGKIPTSAAAMTIAKPTTCH